MFTEKVELDFSDKLIELLEAGRKRAGIEPPKLPEPQEPGPEIEGGGPIQ